MHLEELWLVSHFYRAFIVTEEAAMQETPSLYQGLLTHYTVSSPGSAECTQITDIGPKLVSPYFFKEQETFRAILAVMGFIINI